MDLWSAILRGEKNIGIIRDLRKLRLNETNKITAIVIAAIAVRVVTLWMGRAEFTGWLNHTYYYFVQVRGLLNDGVLPYSDMPLLFYLYSFVVKILNFIGIEQSDSIVISTRIIMCLVPSLIPIFIYKIIKKINGGGQIQRNQWLLILIAGFLPLSLSYMPEFLQKNMVGLLLLSALMYFSIRLLGKFNIKDIVMSGVIALLIVLTHYGTFAAMALYILSLFVSFSLINKDKKNIIISGFVLVVFGVMSTVLIYIFDPQRFERIFFYLSESLTNSLVFALFNGNNNRTENIISFGIIIIFYTILYLFYRIYYRHKDNLANCERIFWLSSILFCGLLVTPLLDHHLMARLASFMSIPLLIILIFNEKYGFKRVWLKRWLYVLMVVGVMFLAIGELMSSKIHNKNNQQIFVDINRLKSQYYFDENDLIITKTGAEHICNWFLGVKSGVITTLNLRDFEKYDDIYILNPIQGELNFGGLENRNVITESDKYFFMQRNIPKPESAEILFKSDNIELYRLKLLPTEWDFNNKGDWNGYIAIPTKPN